MRYVIGLTGGTGAGKSVISNFLKEKGAVIIDADALSREITKEGGIALGEIAEAFPGVIKDGILDRRALGSIVFADKEKLSLLNKITHKYIKKLTEDKIDEAEGLIVLDAPLLFEAGEEALCDKVIFVTARDEVRIKRIMERDSLSLEDATLRIAARNLLPIMEKCDFVVENNGDIEAVKKEVCRIIESCTGKDIKVK